MSNLRVLISTKIFPNAAHPGWAPFNRQQFAALSRLPGVEVVDVLATLPWFPGADLPILRGRSLAQGLGAVPVPVVAEYRPTLPFAPDAVTDTVTSDARVVDRDPSTATDPPFSVIVPRASAD